LEDSPIVTTSKKLVLKAAKPKKKENKPKNTIEIKEPK
jgi:hypothetical protein